MHSVDYNVTAKCHFKIMKYNMQYNLNMNYDPDMKFI